MRGFRWMVAGAALVAGTASAQQTGTPMEQERQQRPQRGLQQPEQMQPGQMQPGQMQPGQMQPGQQAGEISAENWIGELMVVNLWAIELSESVQARATTPQVKQFARDVARDQRQLQQKLSNLAELANVEVPVHSATQGIQSLKEQYLHVALLTSLQGIPMLNGVNVDRAYLSSMVLANDLAINKLQWAMKQVDNQKLNRATSDVLNTLMQNRQRAHRLLGQVAPQVQRGQARQPPARR